MPRLFLSQTMLEEWALDERADLRDGKLVVKSETSSWPVEPAVHFVKLVAGDDEKRLVSRVKTEAQLAQLGAERFEDSVVLGESAYEVIPGYVADVATVARNDKRQPSSPEADLLAAFLLNKMS